MSCVVQWWDVLFVKVCIFDQKREVYLVYVFTNLPNINTGPLLVKFGLHLRPFTSGPFHRRCMGLLSLRKNCIEAVYCIVVERPLPKLEMQGSNFV